MGYGKLMVRDAFNGLVDDVQVYDQALNLDHVNYLHSSPGLAVIPEPSILALSGISGLEAVRAIRRKK